MLFTNNCKKVIPSNYSKLESFKPVLTQSNQNSKVKKYSKHATLKENLLVKNDMVVIT